MKRLTMKWMIAAAALAAVAGSASAQTLKADIPFTFHAGSALLAPGSYQVRMSHLLASTVVVFQNSDNGRSIMLVQSSAGDVSKEWKAAGTPRLGFECAGSRCVLRELWTGSDASAYYFHGPKLGNEGDVRVAEIRMTSVKAD